MVAPFYRCGDGLGELQTLAQGYTASRYQSHDGNQISLPPELKSLTLCPEGSCFPSASLKL